jgi:hypothetical protein
MAGDCRTAEGSRLEPAKAPGSRLGISLLLVAKLGLLLELPVRYVDGNHDVEVLASRMAKQSRRSAVMATNRLSSMQLHLTVEATFRPSILGRWKSSEPRQ